jgi:arginyl-tRNA synthetase
MLTLKQKLQKAIALAVKKTTGLVVKPEEVNLEHPENEKFGDYSTNIAMIIFSKLKVKIKNARELAEAIAKELSLNPSISPARLASQREAGRQYLNISRVEGPGFLNFFLKPDYFLTELIEISKRGDTYGRGELLKGKKIMVEYAHPNTHKQFHIGHLRNITNGEAIVRILESSGAEVIRANYQGDIGLHIAKCLWSLCKDPVLTNRQKDSKITDQLVKTGSLHIKVEMLGKAYTEGNKAYEEDPKAKKEILSINKEIYDHSNPKINKLWQETRQWSLDYFETIYKRVESHFDRYYFESEVFSQGRELVLGGLKKGIFKKSKGAIIFPGSKYHLHDRVFITQEGNPTYEAKDMELGRLQFEEYHPDLIIHNVGPEQGGYFKVVFEALAKLFPKTCGKEYHLTYGWVRLKKGKMSSRSGNVVLGEWLLDEAKEKIKKAFPEVSNEVAEEIAVGAVKYSFLKVSPQTEVAFDFKESISLTGNSGPYLQYTFARGQSVLHKSQISKVKCQNQISNLKSYKVNKEELTILRTIYKFPEVVEEAAKNYSPNLICNFLYDLSQKYNTFYNKHRILQVKSEKLKVKSYNVKLKNENTNFRILLTRATAQVLKNGLYLLGIKTPKKM